MQHQIKHKNLQSHLEMASRLLDMYLAAKEKEVKDQLYQQYIDHVHKSNFGNLYIRADR